MVNKIGATLIVLAVAATVLAGCQQSGSPTTGQSQTTQSSKQVQDKDAKVNLVMKKSLADRNTYVKKISQVPTKSVKADYSVVKTPDTLSGVMNQANLTVEGIVQTVTPDYQTDTSEVTSAYKVYVQKVYAGDKSLVGKSLNFQVFGGLAKNKDIYHAYQQKTFIPKGEKLTDKELQATTYVKENGWSLAAPGDQVFVPLVKRVYEGKTYYSLLTPKLVFYKPIGTTAYIMHTEAGPAVAQATDARAKKGAEAAALKNASETPIETQMQKDVNTLVKTRG